MKPKEEALFLFPILLFFVHIKSPNPKQPRRFHTTGPKPPSIKNPNTKNPVKEINPETLPQTIINEKI